MIANTITPKTPLSSINLNWTIEDLPQNKSTKHIHGVHPYLGKFVPQLAEIFLRKYFAPGDTVLDPFVGSGTTLVEANQLGINSIGCDVSAFNVLLCRVKTGAYNLELAREEAVDILGKVDGCDRRVPANSYLAEWYAPQSASELLTYRDLIDDSQYEYKDLLRVILSRSARSARLTPHFQLDFPSRPQVEPYWCYKHRRTCVPVQSAYKFLRRYTFDTLNRLNEYMRVRTAATVSIIHADSRTVQFGRIDGIITSPPYVGLIDYHEQHCYAYNLLDLIDNRQQEIGAAATGSGLRAKKRYQEGIAQVLFNAAAMLDAGKKVIVVAGDRHNLYSGIAELAGLTIEDELKRSVSRRTGLRAGEFSESIFIMTKKV